MAQIPKESVEKVLEATDIVDLISSYVTLKRAGSQFRANCPFHQEKTPSFYVTPTSQRFHCFGCQKGGDAIAFVREYENLPFSDAVRKLASRAGVVIVEEASDPKAESARRMIGRLKDLHREATAFFHEQLLRNPDAAHARDYMKSRGFGKDVAERWSIGWMPADPRVFLDWARARKFTGRELVDSGIVKLQVEGNPKSGLYVRFQDRLMFPIRNEIGDVIAFSARQLRENKNSGKYINSPETALFKKSRVFFGLDRARSPILKEKAALLCEGQVDAICCHEAGFSHAIATCGTACTPEHGKLIKRYTSSVTLCFDADRAGISATEKAFRALVPEGLSVRVVQMSAGDDPDSYLKANGPEAFRGLLDGAKEFFEFKLDQAKVAGLLDSAAGRTQVMNECIEMLAMITNNTVLDTQLNLVATHLKTSANALRESISKAQKNPRKSHGAKEEDSAASSAPVVPTALHDTVAYLCHLAISSAQAQHFLGEQFETLHEAIRWVEGIPLLEAILGGAPDPSSPASVNTFLASLSEADRLALAQVSGAWSGKSEEPLEAAERSLGMLSGIVLHRRDAALKAEMNQVGLPAGRMVELLQEAKEIQMLMREMGQRSHFNDELPPSTYKEKKSFKNWSDKKKD